MKKKYQNPVLTVVKIETTNIIAASELVGFGSGGMDGSVAAGRRGNFWDDEDDEY